MDASLLAGIALAAAIAIAGVAVWALMSRSRAAARCAALAERAASLEASLADAEAQRDEAARRASELAAELAAKAETIAAAERQRQEMQRDRDQLKTAFEALAAKALKESNEAFMRLAKTAFDGAREKGQAELDARRVAVERMVKPLGETLAKTHERLIALTQQVEMSKATSGELREETARLAKALSRPEIRGQYGEIQLRRVAELAGMTSYCDFDEQVSTRDDDGKLLRPDMIVRLPNECVIAVDAKCNTYAYLEAVNADDDEERKKHLDRFATHVADQADRLGKKQYWAQWEGAPKFVVMFIPGDHFIDAALQRRPELIDTAAQRNVILASPSTLIALLRAVAVGWHEHRLAEQAAELRDLGRELHDRAATAFEHAAELGKAIHRTVKRYNDLVGSVDSRLMPTLRRFEDAGVKSAKALPELKEEHIRPRAIESARFIAETE